MGESEPNSSEVQQAYQKKLQELQQARLMELQRRKVLKQILEPEAYERMANIRSANPGLYDQLASLLVHLYQNNQIKGRVSGEQLKQFIASLLSKRRETKIIRK